MAATYRFRSPGEGFNPSKVPGAYFDCIIEIVAGTADYPTGGYAFGVTQLQAALGTAFSMIESVDVVNHWGTDAGVTAALARYDKTNAKVQAFGMAAAAGVGTGFTEITAAGAAMNGLFCALRVRYH